MNLGHLHARGMATLTRKPALFRVGSSSFVSAAKNVSVAMLAGGSLAAGMLAGHFLDHHPAWGPALATAVIGGFAAGTTSMLLPDAQVNAKRALGLGTYTLGGLGTGIAIMGLLEKKA